MEYTKEEQIEYEEIMKELQSIPAISKNRKKLEDANLKRMQEFNERCRKEKVK